MHLRSAVNFVDFVMLHPHELLLLVSLSSSAARAESDDWTVTAVFFPLFFVSFRHSERWLAMLKSWTCMALNFHHTLGYQPVQQALASGSGPKTADTVTVSQVFCKHNLTVIRKCTHDIEPNVSGFLQQTFFFHHGVSPEFHYLTQRNYTRVQDQLLVLAEF